LAHYTSLLSGWKGLLIPCNGILTAIHRVRTRVGAGKRMDQVGMETYSVYLHIPFCVHRCGYCDFNTYAGLEELIPAYTQALCREILFSAEHSGERLPVHTVFFGGGTPSLLSLDALENILATLTSAFDLQAGVEITLEANPGSLSLDFLKGLRQLGVNRLSLGMQSALAQELVLLERQHGVEDVSNAVSWARRAGFENLSLDLIFGLPEQALSSWEASVRQALAFQPDHLSLYALTLEHGTPLKHHVDAGLLPAPDSDLAADMYESAAELLAEVDFENYEISNWARWGADGSWRMCRHNLQYWRSLPYFGFGAGAHGFVSGVRTANVLTPAVYIRRLQDDQTGAWRVGFPRTPATAQARHPQGREAMGEMMMMGLRLTREGVSLQEFKHRFGVSLLDVYAAPIQRMIELGLLEWSSGSLRLTIHGRLLGNQVFLEFI
jgi:oxygen-independent coproporphyrinogen-3 oxidase